MIKLTPADIDCLIRTLELAEEDAKHGFQPRNVDRLESSWFSLAVATANKADLVDRRRSFQRFLPSG